MQSAKSGRKGRSSTVRRFGGLLRERPLTFHLSGCRYLKIQRSPLKLNSENILSASQIFCGFRKLRRDRKIPSKEVSRCLQSVHSLSQNPINFSFRITILQPAGPLSNQETPTRQTWARKRTRTRTTQSSVNLPATLARTLSRTGSVCAGTLASTRSFQALLNVARYVSFPGFYSLHSPLFHLCPNQSPPPPSSD